MTFKNENEKIAYLQLLCNSFGDFKIQILKQKNNDKIEASKPKSFLELWQNINNKYARNFIKEANQRTLLPPEIVCDIDRKISEEEAIKIFLNVESKLCTLQLFPKYTGLFYNGNSYHIHFIIPMLGFLSTPEERNYLRERILLMLREKGIDYMLSNEKHNIALEFETHWKYGKPKELVAGNWCDLLEKVRI